MLSLVEYGVSSSPGLLIAHGLFGSARNWGAIAKDLSATHHVIVVDMRNHGNSPHEPAMTYADMAQDLAEIIRSRGRMAVLGHSMGGKAAMMLALTQPDLVTRLIVGDIAPVSYQHSHLSHIDAMEAVDLTAVARRKDADAALAQHIPDRSIRGFLLQSLSIENGTASWKLNLPVLRDAMETLVDFPEMTATYTGPALFVAGAQSDYVSAQGRAAIQTHFPGAHLVKLKNAGHWLHADQPAAFTATVKAFLAA